MGNWLEEPSGRRLGATGPPHNWLWGTPAEAAEKPRQIAPCGRGSESGLSVINDLPSRDRRKRSSERLFQHPLAAACGRLSYWLLPPGYFLKICATLFALSFDLPASPSRRCSLLPLALEPTRRSLASSTPCCFALFRIPIPTAWSWFGT